MKSSPISPKEKKTGTRKRILEVSARLFAEHGYSGTTVRNIANVLGISNPSLYYHFESKGEILAELLSEPQQRVEAAIAAAEQLSGIERNRRIISGLLDALEIHSGAALTAFRDIDRIPIRYQDLALEMRPRIEEIFFKDTTVGNQKMRVTMAIGAVDAFVSEQMRSSKDATSFVTNLRNNRDAIIEIVLRILG